MEALLITKTFRDREGGPVYNEDDIWVGDIDRSKEVIDAGLGKKATKNDIINVLEGKNIEFDDKANRDDLIKLLKEG